jgi:hypothetical protein
MTGTSMGMRVQDAQPCAEPDGPARAFDLASVARPAG